MRKTKNIIKINGHTYDAITGDLLHAGEAPASFSAPQPIAAAGSVIEPSDIKPHSTSPAAHTKTVKHTAQKAVAHRQKPKIVSRSPQNSKTLMRNGVRKPSHAANSHDKTHIKATGKVAAATSVVAVKKSVRRIDERRLAQAKQISKSAKVHKFNKTTPVMHTPAQPKHPQPATRIQHHVTTTHPRRVTHKAAHKKTSADLVQEALHHATSHRQPAPRRHLTRSQQALGLSALVVTSGALLAFVAMQSTPTIKMKIASAKAGFAASLPGNSPAGFHMGDLEYGAGAVAMNYKSNSDSDRKFSITQKASSWDSTTLRDAVVAKSDRNFRVVEDSGLTIYLYGNNNATWVSNGVWYQVQGNGSLSDRQLIDIAQSL